MKEQFYHAMMAGKYNVFMPENKTYVDVKHIDLNITTFVLANDLKCLQVSHFQHGFRFFF